MSRLESRLTKLETATSSGVVIVWRNQGETDADATARWRAEHAGRNPGEYGATVLVVGWEAAFGPGPVA